ncbi:MAG: tannase/feruloyl esterase family alpha/beta hydrolase, partial [Rhizobacter sp.]
MHSVRHLTWVALAATTFIAACGGGDDDAPGIPRLAAATAGTLSGTCADLAARLGTLANTTIASTTDVAAGTVVSGVAAPQHCRVLGSMSPRVGPIDG